MKEEEKDFEMLFCENLIRTSPNFTQALSYLGDVYTKRGFYEEGLKIDKRLLALKPNDPTVNYNLACSFSLVGNIENALKYLRRAVLLGYSDLSYILEDEDLANLRRDVRFNKLFYTLKASFPEK